MIVNVSALRASAGATPRKDHAGRDLVHGRPSSGKTFIENIPDECERAFALGMWNAALEHHRPHSQHVRQILSKVADVPATGPFSCFDCEGSETDDKTRAYVHNSRWCMAGNKQTGRVDSVNIVYTRSSRLLNACVGRVVLVANSTYDTMRRWVIEAVQRGDLLRVFLYHGGEDVIVDRGMHRILCANASFVLLYRVDVHPVPEWLQPVAPPPRVLYYGRNMEVALCSTEEAPFAPPPESPRAASSLGHVPAADDGGAASPQAFSDVCTPVHTNESAAAGDACATPQSAVGSWTDQLLRRVRFSRTQDVGDGGGSAAGDSTATADVPVARPFRGSASLSTSTPQSAGAMLTPTPKRRRVVQSATEPRTCAVAQRPVIPRYRPADPFAIFKLARSPGLDLSVCGQRVLEQRGVAVCKRGERSISGIHYDSRHEMRWSMFLTALGIQHVREFATFMFDECKYTPDFYLLHGGLDGRPLWVEIKPCAPTIDAMQRCRALSERGCDVALVYGRPGLPFSYEGESNQYAASECARSLVWRAGRDDYERGCGVFAVDEDTDNPDLQVRMQIVSTDADSVCWDHRWICNAIAIAYFVVP